MTLSQLEIYKQRLAEAHENANPTHGAEYEQNDMHEAFMAGFSAGQAVGELKGKMEFCDHQAYYTQDDDSPAFDYWLEKSAAYEAELAKMLQREQKPDEKKSGAW